MKKLLPALLLLIVCIGSSFNSPGVSRAEIFKKKVLYNPSGVIEFYVDGYKFNIEFEKDGLIPGIVSIYSFAIFDSGSNQITPTQNTLYVEKIDVDLFELKGTLRVPGKNFYFSTAPMLLFVP